MANFTELFAINEKICWLLIEISNNFTYLWRKKKGKIWINLNGPMISKPHIMHGGAQIIIIDNWHQTLQNNDHFDQ